MRSPPKGAGPRGPGAHVVEILLSCPKCGAPFAVDDETRSVACDHCDSLLLLEAPERDELYVVDGQVREQAELLEILIEYRVQAQRAEIVSRYRDEDGNPPSEWFIRNRLKAYEKRLRSLARLIVARELYVPYWHLSGAIVQGLLGRVGDVKQTRVRSFAVEHTVPGYDPGKANLRDRGLRMDRTLVRPLSAAVVAEKGQFLPWTTLAKQTHREIEKWLRRDLDPELEPISKHGEFLGSRRLLVYRPYWIAKAITDKGQAWVLFDGSFRTIAGYPSEPEARGLGALRDRDPLRANAAPYRRVRIVPSRCPDCGAEEHYARDAIVTLCANCHLGLTLTPQGARIHPYDHAVGRAARSDTHYLPFWRFELRARFPDGREAGSVADYVRVLLPAKPPAPPVTSRELWLPAFQLLGTEAGDAAWQAIAEWIHATPPELREGKLPLGGRLSASHASVSQEAARAHGRFALLALHGKPAAARLSHMALQRGLRNLRLELDRARLVMVPFERSGDALVATGTALRLPPLLWQGGPELARLRVSVHRAMARARR